MAWELFADPELQEMFAALAPGNYARSTLPYETIETYAQLHDHRVKLRRLKDGCVKVQLV